MDAGGFRDLFLGEVARDLDAGSFGAAKDHLVFVPPAHLLDEPEATRAEDYFAQLRARFRAVQPEALATGPSATPDPDALSLLARLRERDGQPLTVVVLPGVCSEFVDTRTFEEVFDGASALAVRWRAARPERVIDRSGGQMVTLDRLVSVGSIDDDKGALLAVVHLDTPRLSLESVGSIAWSARTFRRRLDLVFSLLGGPPRCLAFVGYSRGSAIGLELLAGALADGAGWLASVRAMVSLGGVVYGSALADQIDRPGTRSAQQVEILRGFLDGLDPADDWDRISWFSPFGLLGKRSKNAVVRANNLRWADLAARLVALEAEHVARLPFERKVSDLVGSIRGLVEVDPRPGLALAAWIWREFEFWRAFGRPYANNVRGFKVVLGEVLTAMLELRRRARLEWWRSHVVPTEGVRYYALAGTFLPPGSSPLFDDDSLDQHLQRASWQDFVDASGLSLNDGQVSVDSVCFWPGAAPLLNPDQPRPDASFLGILGASHWGMALPTVNARRKGASDPFPRLALLRAIGGAVAADVLA